MTLITKREIKRREKCVAQLAQSEMFIRERLSWMRDDLKVLTRLLDKMHMVTSEYHQKYDADDGLKIVSLYPGEKFPVKK